MSDALEEKMIETLGDSLTGKTPAAPAPAVEELTLNDWEPIDVTFDFEEDFQTATVALAATDPEFMRLTRDALEPGHFDNVGEALLLNIAQSYFDRYSRLPNSMMVWANLIKDALKKGEIRENFKDDIVTALKATRTTDTSDRQYIIDQIQTFSRHQDIMAALNASVSLAQAGKFDEIEKKMNKAFIKGLAGDHRESDYWDDIEKRTQVRKDRAAGLIKPNGISTGIPKLDRLLYHKGFGRRELTALMAGAKRGKSTGLGHFALNMSKQGYNVLYATLEVSVEIVTERMDANVSRTEMDQLEDSVNSVDERVRAARDHAKGVLKVIEYPTGSMTPNALKSCLERYRAQGITFDVIVVDYADIMSPNIYTNSEQENSKQIWVGLRAIAQEENAAVLTATQTNRDGYKQETAKAEHAADDFNKIRIADLVISVNSTEEERARGEARLFFAASRNQKGEMLIRITQDMAKMTFIGKILEIMY